MIIRWIYSYIYLSVPQKSRTNGPLKPPHAVVLLEGKWLIKKKYRAARCRIGRRSCLRPSVEPGRNGSYALAGDFAVLLTQFNTNKMPPRSLASDGSGAGTDAIIKN